jgi:hypothetical protein
VVFPEAEHGRNTERRLRRWVVDQIPSVLKVWIDAGAFTLNNSTSPDLVVLWAYITWLGKVYSAGQEVDCYSCNLEPLVRILYVLILAESFPAPMPRTLNTRPDREAVRVNLMSFFEHLNESLEFYLGDKVFSFMEFASAQKYEASLKSSPSQLEKPSHQLNTHVTEMLEYIFITHALCSNADLRQVVVDFSIFDPPISSHLHKGALQPCVKHLEEFLSNTCVASRNKLSVLAQVDLIKLISWIEINDESGDLSLLLRIVSHQDSFRRELLSRLMRTTAKLFDSCSKTKLEIYSRLNTDMPLQEKL